MDRNTIEKNVKTKKVNSNLNLKVSMPNTDRPIVSCPETQNHLRANKITSHNKINSGNSYPQVQQHRLQNPKNVMHRSKLKNVYNKKRTNVNWANYKKQRNFCVTLLRRTKK